MSTKHAKTAVPSDADLKGNPGIGQSKGLNIVPGGGDLEDIEADSTVEGDVKNETRTDGSIDPDHLGRTNP